MQKKPVNTSTCNHLLGSTTEPGEGCWRSLVPVEQLRNRDDRHFRAVHHSLNLTDKPIMCTWLQGDMLKYLKFHVKHFNVKSRGYDIPECDSCDAPGEEFKLLSILARGERLGCRGWMVKQSVSVSWVAPALDFI